MTVSVTNVFFDLDGTLADTAPDLANTLNQLLQECGKPPMPYNVIRPTVSHGGLYMLQKAFELDENDSELPELRKRFLEIYRSCLANETTLFPGMVELLNELESRAITWGIVTNKSKQLTHPLIQALGLANKAACIVCGDTLEHSKPHPAPILYACKLVKCEPHQSLFIGDAKNDIVAGKNAGMRTLVANYGYIDMDETPDAWGADGMINKPEEILDWLS